MEIGTLVSWTVDDTCSTVGTLVYVTSDEWAGVKFHDGTVSEFPLVQLEICDF